MTTPTFLAFSTASRALSVSQTLLNITGNNIANVNTEGYTRQRVDITSVSLSTTGQKFSSPNVTNTSQGVAATGVSQIRDTFLDARYRTENADNGRYEVLGNNLSDLESIFDEIDTDGLQTQLSEFTAALETFSNSPTDEDVALTVKTAAQSMTAILNSYAQQVTEVREQSIYDLEKGEVVDFNTTLQSIADINGQIRDEEINGNTPNELYDKRNSLIDALSNMTKIKVSTTSEEVANNISVDTLSISMYDESTGTTIALVSGSQYSQISLNNDSSAVSIELTSNIEGQSSGDITDHFTSGTISAYLDTINGAGSYASSGENDYRGTLYYMESLNTFAKTLSNTFNTLNDTGGTGAYLFATADGSSAITASNITISQEWEDDSMFLDATIASDTSTGGNSNILLMIKAMDGDTSFYDSAGTLKFTGTYNEYMTATAAELASDISLNRDYQDTSDTVLSSLADSRDAMSGVSLDEEGVNLLAYQKSYNAAARFMTVLDEMMDTLINSTGVVGR